MTSFAGRIVSWSLRRETASRDRELHPAFPKNAPWRLVRARSVDPSTTDTWRRLRHVRFVPNSEVVASFDHLVSAAGCCAASAAKIESSSSGDFNGNGSTVIPIALAADPRWARKGGLVGFNGLNNVAMVFAFGRTSCWISSIAVQEAAKVGGL